MHKKQWLILPHYKHTGIELFTFPSPSSFPEPGHEQHVLLKD